MIKFIGRVLSNIRMKVADSSIRSSRQQYIFIKEISDYKENSGIRGNLGNLGNLSPIRDYKTKQNNTYRVKPYQDYQDYQKQLKKEENISKIEENNKQESKDGEN